MYINFELFTNTITITTHIQFSNDRLIRIALQTISSIETTKNTHTRTETKQRQFPGQSCMFAFAFRPTRSRNVGRKTNKGRKRQGWPFPEEQGIPTIRAGIAQRNRQNSRHLSGECVFFFWYISFTFCDNWMGRCRCGNFRFRFWNGWMFMMSVLKCFEIDWLGLYYIPVYNRQGYNKLFWFEIINFDWYIFDYVEISDEKSWKDKFFWFVWNREKKIFDQSVSFLKNHVTSSKLY